MAGGKEAVEKSAFDRVVRYFLGHEKPKDDHADKMGKKKAPLGKGKGPAQPKKVTRPKKTKPSA